MRALSPTRLGRLAAVLLGVVVLAPLTSANAQQSADPAATDDVSKGGAAVGDAGRSGGNLGPRQKIDFAVRAEQELGEAVQKVLRLIEGAQRQKDVVLLNCLNDKLGALRGLLKVAGDSRLNLAEAVARENLDLQEHNFRKVFIAKQQSVTVAAEADACVGQVGIVSTGQTRVVVTVEGGSTEGDIGFGAAPGGSSRPPDSSPFRQ